MGAKRSLARWTIGKRACRLSTHQNLQMPNALADPSRAICGAWRAKKGRHPFCKSRHVFQLTFPQDENFPSVRNQALSILPVTLHIPSQLRMPVCSVRTWLPSIEAAGGLMLVPEAAMNENHLSPTRALSGTELP